MDRGSTWSTYDLSQPPFCDEGFTNKKRDGFPSLGQHIIMYPNYEKPHSLCVSRFMCVESHRIFIRSTPSMVILTFAYDGCCLTFVYLLFLSATFRRFDCPTDLQTHTHTGKQTRAGSIFVPWIQRKATLSTKTHTTKQQSIHQYILYSMTMGFIAHIYTCMPWFCFFRSDNQFSSKFFFTIAVPCKG